jgi:hypothetical protein
MARRRTATTEHACPPWCDKNHRRAYPDILAECDLPSYRPRAPADRRARRAVATRPLSEF